MTNKKLIILLLLLATLPGITARAQGVDYNILCNLQQQRTPAMNKVMVWTSNSLVLAPCVPAGMLTAGLATDNQQLVSIGTATGISFLTAFAVTEAVKYTVRRPRPYITYTDDLIPVKTTIGYSFPSGHTSTTFAVATSLSMSCPKWYVVAPSMLWATGVAFSRLYLGVHYPSDVLTGMAVGVLSGITGYLLAQKICAESDVPTTKISIPPIAIKF